MTMHEHQDSNQQNLNNAWIVFNRGMLYPGNRFYIVSLLNILFYVSKLILFKIISNGVEISSIIDRGKVVNKSLY